MADIIFPTVAQKNQGVTVLAASITDSATSLDVVSATELGIPSISGGNFYLITLIATQNYRKNPLSLPETFEIVKVTAVSIGGGAGGSDRLTITRAQDGTTGTAFVAGDVAEHRVVGGHLSAAYNALTDGTTGNLNVAALDVNGDFTLTGAAVNTTWNIFLQRKDVILGTSSPPAAAANVLIGGGTTTGYWVDTLDYDAAAAEFAHFHIKLPADYDGRALKARIFWTATAGTTGLVTVWLIYATNFADNVAFASHAGSLVSISDTVQSLNYMHISPQGTFTPESSTAGDYIYLTLRRNATNASDTFDADARVIGLEISY